MKDRVFGKVMTRKDSNPNIFSPAGSAPTPGNRTVKSAQNGSRSTKFKQISKAEEDAMKES
jgi:hypothetical protein